MPTTAPKDFAQSYGNKKSFHGFLVMRLWYRFLKTLRNNPEMDDKMEVKAESPVLKLKELSQH